MRRIEYRESRGGDAGFGVVRLRRLVALRLESVLASFGSGQQIVELGRSSELHQQGVGLQGRVGTVVLLHGAFQQAQGCIFRAQGPDRAGLLR